MTAKLLEITPTGFEVWMMDKARGREISMTRTDEDRLCDALREEFGDFKVVETHRSWETPKIEWRESISSFQPFARIGAKPVSTSAGPPYEDMGAKLVGVSTVDIYFPWPKWELVGEPLYWDETGTEEQKKASYAGHVVETSSPLSIRFDRSEFLTTESMPEYSWQREALINGYIQTAWCSEGPYAEAQQAFVRKLFRIMGKLTTNRMRFLRFDEKGRITLDEAKKGYMHWGGEDALRWCREDETRVLTEFSALNRETGSVTYGYRPLD